MFRRIVEEDVRELLAHWQSGEGLRSIARATGIDRKTVRRYTDVARALRLQPGDPLELETLQAIMRVVQVSAATVSEAHHALSTHRTRIRAWLAARRSLTAVHAWLLHAGVRVSYATLRRFAIAECAWRPRRPALREAA